MCDLLSFSRLRDLDLLEALFGDDDVDLRRSRRRDVGLGDRLKRSNTKRHEQLFSDADELQGHS